MTQIGGLCTTYMHTERSCLLQIDAYNHYRILTMHIYAHNPE